MNVSITVSLPLKQLTDIQKNVAGKSRAEKIRTCIELGYPLATKHLQAQPLKVRELSHPLSLMEKRNPK